MSAASAFGACIKTMRTARGLTQLALAQRAATDPGYVSRVERGEQLPKLETIQKLARALELDELELTGLLLLAQDVVPPSDGAGAHELNASLAAPVADRPATNGSGPIGLGRLDDRLPVEAVPRFDPRSDEPAFEDDDAAWLRLWAVTLFRAGDHDATRRALATATTALRGGVEDFATLALLAENEGDPALAGDLYRRAVGVAWQLPPDDSVQVELRRSYLRVRARPPGTAPGDAEELADLLAPFPAGSPRFAAMLGACVDHLVRTRQPAAIAYLARLGPAYVAATRGGCDEPYTLVCLAGDLRRYWGEHGVALRLLRAAVELAPHDRDAWRALLLALERAGGLRPEDQRAIVAAHDPNDRLRALVAVAGDGGDLTSVLRDARKVLRSVPPPPLALADDWR